MTILAYKHSFNGPADGLDCPFTIPCTIPSILSPGLSTSGHCASARGVNGCEEHEQALQIPPHPTLGTKGFRKMQNQSTSTNKWWAEGNVCGCLASSGPRYLQGKGPQHHTAEDGVPVDALKHVPLSMYLPGIDFIEELHHDKHIEDDGVVLRRGGVQRGISATVNAENFFAC